MLASLAWEARMGSYAPYSQFHVGAALLSADGRVFTGANVENASLGLTMCAERVALGAAISAGVRSIVAIAVAGESPVGIMPCGACRQALAEFSRSAVVVRCHPDGSHDTTVLADLNPAPFVGGALEMAGA
jgi:cytidine deaminase